MINDNSIEIRDAKKYWGQDAFESSDQILADSGIDKASICTIGQAVFGTCGVTAAVGAVLRREWAGPFALAFAVSAGITAGVASVAWGESGLGTGIASGGLGLLVGVLLYWGISDRTGASAQD